jgi:hypothetical protein
MLQAVRILMAAAIALVPATASADIVWQLVKKQGQPLLRGAPDVSESDTQFWAQCRAGGTIDIGAGADSGVGEGKGEKVTLTLKSGGIDAKLTGVSRNSANFQMTGGTELRATIKRDDAVFKVLAADKPIAVSGSIKPASWPVKGLKAKVAAFLKACK